MISLKIPLNFPLNSPRLHKSDYTPDFLGTKGVWSFRHETCGNFRQVTKCTFDYFVGDVFGSADSQNPPDRGQSRKIGFSKSPASGVRTEENLVNSVFCWFSLEKLTKCSPNPGLVNQFSATPRGRLNWTGPIANGSEIECCSALFMSYSDKEIPLRRSLRWLPCELGSQVGVHRKMALSQRGTVHETSKPWKLKPGFINRVLVEVILEASKCL